MMDDYFLNVFTLIRLVSRDSEIGISGLDVVK